MLNMKLKQVPDKRLVLVRLFRLIPLGTPGLLEYLASLALGYSQLSARLFDYFSSPGRD